MDSMRKLRILVSFPVLLAVTLAAATVLLNTHNGGGIFEEGDTWWHLSAGERILATGQVPHSDPYSFSALGTSWVAYEWLGEIVMAEAQRLGSLRGLAILLIFASVCLVLLTFAYAWLRTANLLAAAAATAIVLPFEQVGFTLRPQIFGYILLALTLIVLELYKQRESKLIWVLPAIFAIWVNTHGTFIVGLAIVSWYWLSGLFTWSEGSLIARMWTGSGRLRFLLVTALSVGALILTPYGTRLAAYPIELWFHQPLNTLYIPEWMPLDLQTPLGRAFVVLLLVLLLAQIAMRLEYPLEVVVPLLCSAYLTSVHRRFVVIFLLMVAPVLATYLSRLLPAYRESKEIYSMNAIFILVLLLGIIRMNPTDGTLMEWVAEKYPAGAVAYLKNHPVEKTMFNDDHWGGFLIWSLGPSQKVFIDGRLDIYEYSGVLRDYLRLVAYPSDWETVFQKYGVDACLLNRERQADLAATIVRDPTWKTAYSDNQSVILLRASHVDP